MEVRPQKKGVITAISECLIQRNDLAGIHLRDMPSLAAERDLNKR
jgi:hypothetical protein